MSAALTSTAIADARAPYTTMTRVTQYSVPAEVDDPRREPRKTPVVSVAGVERQQQAAARAIHPSRGEPRVGKLSASSRPESAARG